MGDLRKKADRLLLSSIHSQEAGDPLREAIALDEACLTLLNVEGENKERLFRQLTALRPSFKVCMREGKTEDDKILAAQWRMSNARHLIQAALLCSDISGANHWCKVLFRDPVFHDPKRVDPKIQQQIIQEIREAYAAAHASPPETLVFPEERR